MLRHTTFCAVVVVIALMGTYAQAGDCDSLRGNAWGLCNAYCEAMNCDDLENHNASDQACTQVATNFYRATGLDKMPCYTAPSPAGSQLGSCPCNFDVQLWTAQTQILDSTGLPMCNGTFDACMTCDINTLSGPTTFLGVTVNRWDNGFSSQEDTLFFFTTDPSSLAGGACGADISFASGYTFTTEGGQLDVTSEQQFSACVSDIGALQSAYVAMCSR